MQRSKRPKESLSKAIYKMLAADPKALQVRPCTPRRHSQPEASLAPSLAMTPAHAGFGVASGGAWIWSEQSHGAGEASHASLSAQRGLRERRGNGWEVCRWLIITHTCSTHFHQSYLLSVRLVLISTLCRLFDCVSEGKYLHDSPLAEGGP